MGRAPAAIRWHVRLEARLFAGVTLIIGLALTAIAVAAHDIVTSNAAAPLTAEDEAALRLGLIWITAFTFVLAAAAAAVFSRHLTTPLRTIETAAREIAAGRWDRPVPAPGGTEAAVIAAAFNEMSASLTHWHSEASSLAERERAREALRRSEERFHLATKATNDIIWDWDLVTNELWWSDGAPALLGRIDGTPSVERWRELIHPDDRDRVVAGLDAFLKTDEPVWSAEYRLRRAGGAYAWILDRAHVTRDAERHPQRMIGSWMDISERKEAERMKSDFVSFVSHQLRTPLSGVNWMLELATDSAGSQERDEYIGEARASAQRLIALVNDLLDISRLESGKLTIVPEPVRLDVLTRNVIQEMMLLVEERKHRLTFEVAGRPPAITADAQLLRQVITNLLSNAIKYTPRTGTIAITLNEQHGSVRWAIRDSGIGIPEAAQARLFEKFYRADNALTIEADGSGLGLNLVRMIVEQFRGRIWCESREGEGATFVFTLPCEIPLAAGDGTRNEAAAEASPR